MAASLIVVAWLLLPLASLWLVARMRPHLTRDPEMAWHFWFTTLIAGIEPIGLILATSLSQWPSAVIYMGSLGVLIWRIVLFEQTQNRARRARKK